MATYLQGVTDYIPDYQPFQPDLNFYGGLMQTKQNQYDTNWQSLNNLYGQLYGADLTHDLNIEKKDELLKKIDFNLKRVSGLDLSLEQNVDQAMQVFKPFYEDKYLIKDMAYTKNWNNTYAAANALKNSKDEKQRGQWWGTGIQGLELRRQMFKDATLDETLTMGNAEYTPNVNVIKEYMDLAKKYNIGAVQTLPDQSGLYLVKKKNGDLILPTLQNMFLAEYANRPDIQDKYREEAFVERMNYAEQNAGKYGGNKLEAEKVYIKEKYDWLKNYSETRNAKAQDELKTTQNLQGNLEKDIKDGNVNPQQASYNDRLMEALNINSAVAGNAESLNDQINDNQADGNAQGYNEDILSNIELARLKVDAGFASVAAEQGIIQAANNYATANAEIEYKANAVGLEFLRDKQAKARQQQGHKDRLEEIQAQSDAKVYEKAIDFNVSKGYWTYNQDGTLNTNPQVQGFGVNFLTPDGTTTSEVMSIDAANEMIQDQLITQTATAPVSNLMKFINQGATTNAFTAAQLAQFVLNFNPSQPLAKKILKEGSKNYKPDILKVWNTIWDSYKKDPTSFTNKTVGSGQMFNVNKLMQNWSVQHSGDGLSVAYFKDPSMIDLQQLGRTSKAMNEIRNKNYDKIETKFENDLTEIVRKAKQKDPRIKAGESEIGRAVDLMMRHYALDGHGNLDEFKKMAPKYDQEIAGILGFSIGKTTNQKAEMKWYNYLVPLTNIPRLIGDGRENVDSKASWIADVFDYSYNELAKEKDPKKGLATYVVNGVNRSGNQVTLATETGNMKVAPGVISDPGNVAASQMFTTILGTNWNNDKFKYRITTGNNILPGSDDAWEDTGVSQDEALAMVRDLKIRLNTDKELKPFFIGATTMSMESSNLGSMKVMVPKDIIEKVITSGGTKEEIASKIDRIYKNGITFIAPKGTWESNALYGKQFRTPTEVLLDLEPIEYKHPGGAGSYRIEKTPGTADYMGSYQGLILKPDGTKEELEPRMFSVDVRSGQTIEEKDKEAHNFLQQVYALNLETFKRIHQSGDQTKIQAAQKNFGSTIANPFWQNNK